MKAMKALLSRALRESLGPALLAASVGVVAMFVVRYLLLIPTPPELYGDRATVLIPVTLFSALLQTFGSTAKHIFFAALVIGAALLAVVFGVVYWAARLWGATRNASSASRLGVLPGWPDALLVWALLYALTAGILAPLLGGGFLGAQFQTGVGGTLLSLLTPITAFSAAFIPLLRRNLQNTSEDAGETATAAGRLSRRRLLGQGAFAAAVIGGGIIAWQFITSGLGAGIGLRTPSARPAGLNFANTPKRIEPPPTPEYGAWTAVDGETPEVTPTEEFYYVSKDILDDPRVDEKTWKLEIKGQVAHPYALTYAQLTSLPRIERYHTLECISNEVGGNLMSNALFVGASLADAVQRAGVTAGASELIFAAADGYSDSIPLSLALDPRSLIVYQINGGPLPIPHGFPARLLVPGLYGMKNGKWLTSLTLGTGGYTGYWEERGWTRTAGVKTTTRIDLPLDGDTLAARPTFITGVAYAADRGIARVDVSVDAGVTWHMATLRRPLGNLTWTLWEIPWRPEPGGYYIVARAVELNGDVQTPDDEPPIPYGATGYHVIHVTAR
jgi:DMSO/TMAO reductase YedYZ molybdopterin-dependent catalytic subunit